MMPVDDNNIPVPDPTKLTTDAIEQARSHTDNEIRHLEEKLSERITGMDNAEREKICRFNDKFKTIEAQRLEQKADVKAAVDAALAAQKEAIGKSETATKEQITALG